MSVPVRRKKSAVDEMRTEVAAVKQGLAVHEAVCTQRWEAVNSKLNWMLIGMAVLTVLSFMGPHDGIMALLAKLKG